MSELLHIKEWMQALPAFALPLIETLNHSEQKPDGSPVTEVDKAIEQWLREKIMRTYPQDGIIGEELEAHQPTATRQWIIDPIDGTRALLEGNPTYTTLIALLDNNIPLYSAMLQPITSELWISDGDETRYNSERINCTKVDAITAATFSTTSPDLFREDDQQLIQIILRTATKVQLGEDGYAYGKLAKGDVHLVVESGLKPYDFMPLVPIVEGSGAIITDWKGAPLTVQSSGDVIATSSKALHQYAIALLNAHDT